MGRYAFILTSFPPFLVRHSTCEKQNIIQVLVSLTEEELTKYLSVKIEDVAKLYTDIKLLP